MRELLASVVARIFWIPDVESVFTRLFRDDRALERSIHFTSTFVTLGNVLGHTPKDRISDWYEPNARNFQVLRSAVWDAEVRTAEAAGGIPLGCGHDNTDDGDPPVKHLDFGRTKHDRMKTVSLIREMLWDRAGWNATLFLSFEDGSELPAFAPTFKEPAPAGEIFAELRKEIGLEDSKEILRVVIVRGINKKKPKAYRVVIGTNIRPDVNLERGELLFAVSRVQTMYPDSEENLERFLRDYRKAGAYHLIHGIMRGGPSEAEPVWDNYILKRELIVKYAWEVGRHDPDAVGILEDDDPIIPPDQGNAPVLELLAWKRKRALQSGDRPSCSAKDSRASLPSHLSPKEQAAARKANRKRDKKAAKKKKKR